MSGLARTKEFPFSSTSCWPKTFIPSRNAAARDWARLAKRAGQKVHGDDHQASRGLLHTGIRQADRLQRRQAGTGGADLVREFVEAARAGKGCACRLLTLLAHGLAPSRRLPSAKTDEAARQRFVAYTHGLIRELLTNYGKIDILWYDVSWPLTPAQWESERMNEMVFELQPEILVNNRNGLPGDFTTPEQRHPGTGPEHRGAWQKPA